MDVITQIITHEMANGGVSAVLHCGDFGAYDCDVLTRLSEREQYLIAKHNDPVQMFGPYLEGNKAFAVPVYAIPGNHEDFILVDDLVAGTVKVGGLRMFGQGEIIAIAAAPQELSVMGLGKVLPEGLTHSNKPKLIQKEDINRATDAGTARKVDVLLLHEPPWLRNEYGNKFGSSFLTRLIKAIKPRLVVAGHMHFEYLSQIDASQIIGLGYGVEGRYAILDADMQVTFKSLHDDPIGVKTVYEITPLPELVEKKSNRQLPLLTGGEVCAHFGLNDHPGSKELLTSFFKALRLQMLNAPHMDKAQALVFAEQFFAAQTNGSSVPTLPVT